MSMRSIRRTYQRAMDSITGVFHDMSLRKLARRTSFRRGTSFDGALSGFIDDPHEVLKKRFRSESREYADSQQAMKLLSRMEIPSVDHERFMDHFIKSMTLGLSTHKNASDLKMIPTYITRLPTGKEVGEYLALDLGGTNFRVLRCILNGNPAEYVLDSVRYTITDSVMKSQGNELFEFIANRILAFFNEKGLDVDKEYKLGFTFSFPCDQRSIKKAFLLKWTKGFNCPDIIGRDVVGLLQMAINKTPLKIKVVALINDTVGTLITCAYKHPTCAMGIIVGTGSNACYVERMENIHNVPHLRSKDEHMIINIEWGAYGDTHESYNLNKYITQFDKEIDQESINPGQQKLEKLMSGMYIGEMVRKIILYLQEQKLIFKESTSKHSDSLKYDMRIMTKKDAFQTQYVSSIELDRGKRFKETKKILAWLGIPEATFYDCAVIHFVCRLVTKRAAKLLGFAMSAVVAKIDRRDLAIGVDGSLYRHHPKFMQDAEYWCNFCIPPEINYSVSLATDGSGIGAALAAAATEN